MATDRLILRFVLQNTKAVRALAEALQLAEELREDVPWKPEAEAIIKRLRYAARHFTAKVEPRDR